MVVRLPFGDRLKPRSGAVRWALAIAASGILLPPAALFATWAVYALFGTDAEVSGRLLGLLTPNPRRWAGLTVFLALQALPFLAQALVAWVLLSSKRGAGHGASWRIAGCHLGLCAATVYTYALVVPGLGQWRAAGLSAPLTLFAYLYGGGGLAALVGGWIGRALWRHVHHRQRYHRTVAAHKEPPHRATKDES